MNLNIVLHSKSELKPNTKIVPMKSAILPDTAENLYIKIERIRTNIE